MPTPPPNLASPALLHTEAKLGFDAVAHALAEHCRSARGQQMARSLPWLRTQHEVESALAEVDEAGRLTEAGLTLPQGPAVDVEPLLAQADRGAALSGSELWQLRELATALTGLRSFAEREAPVWPALAEACTMSGAGARELTELARTLTAALAADGSLRDGASAELGELRARLQASERRLRDSMQEALLDPNVAPHLQDDFVSLRNGRYVLPVVASFQAKVPGIVHNASQTGQTLFIEPFASVPLGNQLVVLRAQVEEEEARLRELLSREVQAQAEALRAGTHVLGALDVRFAASELSRRHAWRAPRLAPHDAAPQLRGLRHPELELRGRRVVPNDVVLATGQRALVLSGPNAGGKTVTLRAVGLCVRMVRAGLPVPLAREAVLPLYTDLFADVGDAQDIGAGTSSFSAHLGALHRATRAAGPGVLVLLDEVGKDTDPSEGAALARAVLEALLDAGATVVATTHLEAIKALAHLDARFVNARIELEPNSLRPTHRLQFGAAGRSYAFAVARQVGMDDALVARARVHLQGGEGQLAQALADLEAQHVALAAAQADAQAEAERLRRQREGWVAEQEQEAARAEAERRDAARVLARALDDAAAQLNKHLTALTQPGARAGAANDEAARQRAAWHREAAAARAAAGPALPPGEGAEAAAPALAARGTPLAAGSPVWITTLARAGEVVDLHDGQATVALGAMRTRVPLATLRPLKARAAARGTAGPGGAKGGRGASRLVPAADGGARAPAGRCDLRGMRLDEAERALTQAMDACLSEGSGTLWVWHGHGTGALQKMVRNTLASSPYVAQHRPGADHEGGDGVTLAFFDAEG